MLSYFVHQDRNFSNRIKFPEPLGLCHQRTVDYFIVNTLRIQAEHGPLGIGTEPIQGKIISIWRFIPNKPHVDQCELICIYFRHRAPCGMVNTCKRVCTGIANMSSSLDQILRLEN